MRITFRDFMKSLIIGGFGFVLMLVLSQSCTQEQQNRLTRSIQNWTGTNGVLDVLGGDKVMYRFIEIDKLTTGMSDGKQRSYRYGYGYFDKNQNFKVDKGEKKVYFEVSDYSTIYLFYANPN